MECYNELSMANKFALIKHESMGNGIVISNNGQRTIEVGFVDDGIKILTVDNPFISETHMSVMEFINDELYEYLFDAHTKEKGKEYNSPFKIQSLEITDNCVTGSVFGTEEYRFTLEISGGYIYLSCSCPVIGLCKHLYAACLFLKQNYAKVSQRNITNIENKAKKIRPLLDNYLYYNLDSTNYRTLFTLYDYIIQEDNFDAFLIESYSFYNRNQYHNKIIDTLLYPLTFDPSISKWYQEYLASGANENIKNMIKEVVDYPNSINYQKAQKNRTHRIRYDLFKVVFDGDFDSLINLEDLSERDYQAYAFSLCKLLTLKELSFEQIRAVSQTSNFIRTSRFIYGVYITFRGIKGRNNLLFIDQANNLEEVLKDAPIEFVISQLNGSNNPLKFLPVINNRFNEINKEDYSILADAISYVAITGNFLKEQDKNVIFSIVDRMDNNIFLKELADHNLNRNGYWR